MTRPRISVLLAVFNGEAFLSQQLESLAAQSMLPDELVVCDDASTDASWHILERYAACAPFAVRMQRNEKNLGYSRNFGRCLEMAQGEILFFCDQDDVWFPEKIASVVQKMESRDDVLLVIHDGKLVDENLIWQGACKLGQVKALYAPERFVTGSLTVIRRPLATLAQPLPDQISHDVWIHALALALDARQIDPQPLQLIRRHGRNASLGRSSTLRPFTRWQAMLLRCRWRDHQYWEEEAYVDREVVRRLRFRAQTVGPFIRSDLPVRLARLLRRAKRIERWRSWPGSRFLFKFL